MDLSPRDLLIDDVQHGRKTPEEAEAEATSLGIGPLARRPNLGDFDPMTETWWTLPMTIAWILWRSGEQVREHWDKYRLDCWDWHFRQWQVGPDGDVHQGWFLQQRPTASLERLILAETYEAIDGGPPRYARTAVQAKECLWRALAGGVISATAVDRELRKRARVRSDEWIDLDTHEEHDREVVRPRLESAPVGPVYEDLRFQRSVVMEYWPPAVPEESGYGGSEQTTPTGEGFMPLGCAAQWIASHGNIIDPNVLSDEDWLIAFQQLVGAVATGKAKIIGMRDGEMQPIPAYTFAACRIHLPWAPQLDDPSDGDELYLRAWYFTSQEEWNEINDSLVHRRLERWTKLMIARSDVAELWPFHLQSAETNQDMSVELQPLIMMSGAPGRPTSMHLVVPEHRRRLESGEAKKGVKEEARSLAEWLVRSHPTAPGLTPKTIENKIRTEHRRHRATPQN